MIAAAIGFAFLATVIVCSTILVVDWIMREEVDDSDEG